MRTNRPPVRVLAAAVLLAAMPALALAASLGGIATLDLPRGTVATPAAGAEFDAFRRVRGDALLFAGTVAHPGDPPIRYEFFRTGHVAQPTPGSLDPDMRLAELAVDANPDWRPIGWRVPPQWSERAMQLRWAYEVRSAQTEQRRVLGFAAFLTREGVLLFSHTSTDPRMFRDDDARFRKLLEGVHMRPERGWLDLRGDDPRSPYDASALIASRGAPPVHMGPTPIATTPAGDLRALLQDPESLLKDPNRLLAIARRVPWGAVAAGLVLLRLIAALMRKRRAETEEIRLPPEAGEISSAQPIEPEEPRRRR